jgi:integrase
MKHVSTSSEATTATLQDVLDRIAATPNIAQGRKRDLRSAILSFGKLADKAPASILLDLSELRRVLDETDGTLAKVTAKRRANLRSDLTTAIETSGLHPMLRTSGLELDPAWKILLDPIHDQRIRAGLSRFARWCSLHGISPETVAEAVVNRFAQDLKARTLVRNVEDQRGAVVTAWNRLAALKPDLAAFPTPSRPKVLKRVPWEHLPATFFADLQEHLAWCAMPDALDDDARGTRLAPATIRLRRDHVHSATTAAIAAGISAESLRTLADLVQFDTFKAILRRLYADDGSKLTAYTHGVAGTLIAIAKESAGSSADEVAALKKLRRKLGVLPSSLTDKNKSFLRRFDDTRLLDSLLALPDKIWRNARRGLTKSKRPFIDMKRPFIDIQTSLAIDILLAIPLRMKNLASLNFREHLHWPNGRGKPAMLIISGSETKNGIAVEAEIATELADRLWTYRSEIAPDVIRKRPDALFVTTTGTVRTQGAVAVSIEKAVYRHLGIRLTPHQFRHFAAKVILDANPGAHELVRRLLVHKNMKTTTNYYAGIDTMRAGRAHAELLVKLKNESSLPKRKRSKSSENGGPRV